MFLINYEIPFTSIEGAEGSDKLRDPRLPESEGGPSSRHQILYIAWGLRGESWRVRGTSSRCTISKGRSSSRSSGRRWSSSAPATHQAPSRGGSSRSSSRSPPRGPASLSLLPSPDSEGPSTTSQRTTSSWPAANRSTTSEGSSRGTSTASFAG